MIAELKMLVAALVPLCYALTDYFTAQAGKPVAIQEKLPLASPAVNDVPGAKRARRTPRAVAVDAVLEPKPEPVAPASPFGDLGSAVKTETPTAEQAAEAKKRALEVGGLFVRRYQNAKPAGLDRFKGELVACCGRPIAKIEELTYADHVKMIPHFEALLDQADKAGAK